MFLFMMSSIFLQFFQYRMLSCLQNPHCEQPLQNRIWSLKSTFFFFGLSETEIVEEGLILKPSASKNSSEKLDFSSYDDMLIFENFRANNELIILKIDLNICFTNKDIIVKFLIKQKKIFFLKKKIE